MHRRFEYEIYFRHNFYNFYNLSLLVHIYLLISAVCLTAGGGGGNDGGGGDGSGDGGGDSDGAVV